MKKEQDGAAYDYINWAQAVCPEPKRKLHINAMFKCGIQVGQDDHMDVVVAQTGNKDVTCLASAI